MPWTAALNSFRNDRSNGNVVASVTYSNGAETITQEVSGNDLTADNLAAFTQRRVALYETQDASLASLVAHGIGLISIKPRSPEEIAADEFFALQADLNALLLQLERGFIKEDDASLATARDAVKQAFLPEYAKDPRFR